MSEGLPFAPRSPALRGVINRGFAIGVGPIGSPISQKAYVTPFFPSGISVAELREAPQKDQTTTILAWFYSNFRPLTGASGDLAYGKGPNDADGYGMGGYGLGGYGGGARPSSVVLGSSAIKLEFEAVVSDLLIEDLGAVLDGTESGGPIQSRRFWEQIDPLPGMLLAETGEPLTDENGQPILLETLSKERRRQQILDEIAEVQRDLGLGSSDSSQSPGIGHNSRSETEEINALLEQVKVNIQHDPAIGRTTQEETIPLLKKSSDLARSLAKKFLEGLATGLGLYVAAHPLLIYNSIKFIITLVQSLA